MKNIVLSNDCETIAKEIDRLTDTSDQQGLKSYLLQIETAISSDDAFVSGPVFYYLGTAFSTLSAWSQKHSGAGENVDFVKYNKKSLFYLRRSIDLLETQKPMDPLLLMSAYTNYANVLDSCCRVIESLRIYRKCIRLNPKFGMALGNYGRTLQFYANTVNDAGHYTELHCYAYQAVKRALNLQDPNVHNSARKYFEQILINYEATGQKELLEEPIVFKTYSMGVNQELEYRKWCLKNHLFLNPLNDLIEQESAFAHDSLVITRYSENVGDTKGEKRNDIEPPKCFSMLNQLKEEYIYARFLLFEATKQAREVHYADKNVKIALSSYEYANYSIRLEQIKSAYKTLFSVIDKVAFAINSCWKLGIKERNASAEKVFNCKQYPKNNHALSAMFWSYCEFSDDFCESETGSERDLKILRNAFEHKFVKIHEFHKDRKLEIESDDFYHVSEEDLKKHALRLLEISREFIMEFTYAIGIEENKLNAEEKATVFLPIIDFDDKWKV